MWEVRARPPHRLVRFERCWHSNEETDYTARWPPASTAFNEPDLQGIANFHPLRDYVIGNVAELKSVLEKRFDHE